MRIILTSFVEAKKLKQTDPWSGARSAPDFAKGWPVARWAQPKDREVGFPWLLRDFGGEGMGKTRGYFAYALNEYRNRWPEIKTWLYDRQVAMKDVALCCWCPYSKTAQAQLKQYGTFHCHLGVIGHIFDTLNLDWGYGFQHNEMMVRHGE